MPSRCPSCQYDLTGLAQDRCPECGVKPLEYVRPRRVRKHEAAVGALSVAGLISLLFSTFASISLPVLVGETVGALWVVLALLIGPWIVPAVIFAGAAWLDDQAEKAMEWPRWRYTLALWLAWTPIGLMMLAVLGCVGAVVF
ncbi:MAG: hypothetical protein AAGI17_00645 [Planctomycetota bacterium]